MDDLLSRIEKLESENVETTNVLYELSNHIELVDARIDILSVEAFTKMYELDSFELALAHFGTRVDIIIALEMGGKIDSDSAYKNIKYELKELKKLRKKYNKEVQ